MSDQVAERKHKALKNAKKNLRSRGMAKSLAAREHVNRPASEPPLRSHEFMAIAENAPRGMMSVPRGDGSTIEFKNAQYLTNDAAEAKLLEKTPGVKVERFKNHGARRMVFAVPALPWHEKSHSATDADTEVTEIDVR